MKDLLHSLKHQLQSLTKIKKIVDSDIKKLNAQIENEEIKMGGKQLNIIDEIIKKEQDNE